MGFYETRYVDDLKTLLVIALHNYCIVCIK
jgi:hypothetical protein